MAEEFDRTRSVSPKKRFRVWVGWIVSVGLLIAAFRIVPIDEAWAAARQVHWGLILLAMAFGGIGLSFRGGRWASIIRVRKEVPRIEASRILLASMAINCVAPGRIGDFVRIGMAVKRLKLDPVFAVASLLAERLLDSAALLAFLAISLCTVSLSRSADSAQVVGSSVESGDIYLAVISIVVSGLVIVGILVLFSWPPAISFLVRIIERLPFPGEKKKEALSKALENLSVNARELSHPRKLANLTALSVAVWLPLVLTNYVVAQGYPGLELSFDEILLLTAVGTALGAVPSAPGGWGVYEAGGFLILKALGKTAPDATILAFVFVAHFCGYVPTVLAGALSMLPNRGKAARDLAVPEEDPIEGD